MLLDATTEAIRVTTESAGSVDYFTEYVDRASGALSADNTHGNITTATTTTVVASPAASTERVVRRAILYNRSTTASNAVVIKLDDGGTERHIARAVLRPLESLRYDGEEWHVWGADGLPRISSAQLAPYGGFPVDAYKIGTVSEAVATWHSLHAATGYPGAWSPGTPGLNGRATDGTTAADGGCLPIPNPAAGGNYLVGFQAQGTVVQPIALHDVLWVNTGLVVTTTTAQALASAAWPARDLNGSTNGLGVQIAILVTTATTNAAVITNTTMSYTNQDGTAGRTATISSFPATAVAGTIVWFQLQAGDSGVRSIQSVTLGTSYGGGAISLIATRRLALAPCTVVNIAAASPLRPAEQGSAGVRLWNGTCALLAYRATATTATTVDALATIEVR